VSLPNPTFMTPNGSSAGARYASAPASYSPEGKASAVPVIVASAALLVGIACTVLGESVWFALGGYVAAGFVTVVCLGWDNSSQRRGLKNPNFIFNPRYSRILQVIVFLGFVVAIVDLVRIAFPIAELLTNQGGA
jgi:hypothetical protein